MKQNHRPGQLSQHFQRQEFSCHCGCGFAVADAELVMVLEDLRANFGDRTVIITSGCRCKDHNARVGGAPASQHLHGMAADINVNGVDPDAVADYLSGRYPNSYGIGRYPSWTHIDVRLAPSRW